jgi:predicted Zn-dependent protease
MKRRQWLRWGCAHCAGLVGIGLASRALADSPASPAVNADWAVPDRFTRPKLDDEEGGLWALMDREETRLRRSPFRMREGKLEQYLLDVCCKLAGPHCPDIRVYALRQPSFNASMAPNGMMQVWSGLLLRVENEAQLAAVLGHEIGHYVQRHSLEQLRDMRARMGVVQFMSAFGVAGAIGQLATMAGASAYSREHERDADQIGILLMRRAGYDTREAHKIWTNLQVEQKANSGYSAPNTLFASHPATDERRETLARLSANDSGESFQAQYRAIIAPWRNTLLEDELKRSRPGESLALFNRLLEQEPGDPVLLHYRGEAYRLRADENDVHLALADYQAAIDSGNAPASTWRALGQTQLKLGQAQAGQQALHNYLNLAPQAPDSNLIKQMLQGTQ